MESLCLKSVASNKGLKLTALGGGPVGRGAPQLNPVFGGRHGRIEMIRKSGAKRIVMLALAGSWVAPTASLAQDEPPGFVQVLPSTIRWRPSPAVPGSQVAVLLGNPQEGPFVIRVKLEPWARVMPHTHSQARTYTVLSGEWKLGFGDRYDAAALRSFPPGSLYRLPAKVPHFQAAGPVETIVQIDSVGPSSTDFINPLDDPRRR